jgi:hypothetical protein
MFQPNWPSSGVQVVVMKESAANTDHITQYSKNYRKHQTAAHNTHYILYNTTDVTETPTANNCDG